MVCLLFFAPPHHLDRLHDAGLQTADAVYCRHFPPAAELILAPVLWFLCSTHQAEWRADVDGWLGFHHLL
jgi:hypothetical protein